MTKNMFTENFSLFPLDSRFHVDRDFKIIVLTGGPGGGKSTLLDVVKEWLKKEYGYSVYTMKEVASEMFDSGLLINPEFHIPNEDFQPIKISYQLAKENFFVQGVGRSVAKKKVLFLDRGVMDDKQYAGQPLFEEILRKYGLSYMDVRDRRYDAVLHHETAASLGDEYYINNVNRTESPEGARKRDLSTVESWVGHRHHRIIPAMIDFDKKLQLLKRHVLQILGEPEPLEIERKFLVEYCDPSKFSVPAETFQISQTYLKPNREGVCPRIRSVHQGSSAMFFETKKTFISAKKCREEERELSLDEYLDLLYDNDPKLCTIEKRRTYFIYNKQCFELDLFEQPYNNLALMEVELLSENDPIDLPPFIKIIREVTDDMRYKNGALAGLSLGTPGSIKE